MSNSNTILALIAASLTLIKPNKDAQTRRNIKRAFKNYRKIKKLMKRNDGVIDKQEREALDKLMHKLIIAQDKLFYL
jgi:hypothetical protein